MEVIVLRRVVAACVIMSSLGVRASATDLTVDMVDQMGAPIPGSRISINGPGVSHTGDAGVPVTVPAGTYDVRLFPGISASNQSLLYRDEVLVVAGAVQAESYTWRIEGLTVHIVDQGNVPIAASATSLLAVPAPPIANGGTLLLPVTTDPAAPTTQGPLAAGYQPRLFPGIIGMGQGGSLYRDEPASPLGPGGLSLTFTWPLATLTASVLDQFGAPVAGTRMTADAGSIDAIIDNGFSVTLPVTDDPNAPLIEGIAADGYAMVLFPGFLGSTQGGFLLRTEEAVELTSAGLVRTFTWPHGLLSVDVVDQDQALIANSHTVVDAGPVDGILGHGDALAFPVSEDANEPSIAGPLASGYPLRVFPGINGVQQGSFLWRVEGPVDLSQDELVTVTWEVARGELSVVDATDVEVPGASFALSPFAAGPTGTTVGLPVNDDAMFATLQGPAAGGYPFLVTLLAGGPTLGPVDFEVLAGEVIHPPFVTVGADTFGLRFDLQTVIDVDGDGFTPPDDCDDSDPSVFPGAPDLPGDAIDQDCDGVLSCDPAATWKNHGKFVSCVAQAAQALVDAGQITEDEKDALVEAAAQSDVGKK